MHRTPNALAILVLAVSILAAPPSQAEIEACAGVSATQPTLASLTGGSQPSGPRPAELRQPIPADVSGAALSFWDHVPDPFFVALTVPREQIEAMGPKDWIEAVAHWNRLQQGLRNPLAPSAPPSTHYEIDWLFAMARSGEPVSQRDWIEQGIGSDISVDPTVDGLRLLREPVTDDRLWLMVAGLYARNRLTVSSLMQPQSSSTFDRFWQVFPDAGEASASAERNRLRQYLCNHPSTRLLQLEAAADTAEARQRAEAELSAYVEATIADFDELSSFLNSGAALNGWLDLVPQDSIRAALREAVLDAGPAKAYLLLKEELYDGIAERGEIGRKQAIWSSSPGYVQFLWPDPCLSAAVYPSTTSPLYGAPWAMQTRCKSQVQDRDALRLAIQERQP